MPVGSQVQRIASAANLQLAWDRVARSTERTYREYFRPFYRAFALASKSRLNDIRNALLSDSYDPSSATRVYFLKPTGLQRVYTLLSVEDHVTYQAISNLVADRLFPRVHHRYYRSVFGHVYAGPGAPFFYRDWRRSYTAFTGAMRKAFTDGYVVGASFDLTACYDSIDHGVLSHFLSRIGVQQEVAILLCRLLKHWTDSSSRKPIHHNHGIPQGPVPSGLISEVVLRHFDETDRRRQLRYFRYVDDIRLFARDEPTLRHELFNLDIKSKEIGLFPQSSKLKIHRITNIEDEIKGISQPTDPRFRLVPRKQPVVRKRLISLSPRFRVRNITQFKFDLGTAQPTTPLTLRLLEILDREPSLVDAVARYLARCPQLTRKASRRVLEVLRNHDLYPGYTAALLRAIRENFHPSTRATLYSYCRTRLSGPRSSKSAELRAAAGAILLWDSQISWQESRDLMAWKYSWWLRGWLPGFLQPGHIGAPSYQALVQDLLCDESNDVALVGAELVVTHRLPVPRPMTGVNVAAQQLFRDVGKIGRINATYCPIRAKVTKVLGSVSSAVSWKTVLDRKTYRLMVPRISVWESYATTDSTAWVVMTDTINDILVDALHKHDPTLGGYTLGNIGGALRATSRFAQKYPKLYAVADRIHQLRLNADLAHPVTRSTNAPTRRIPSRDAKKLRAPLAAAYLELWTKW
jgi:retron-type reverse transcriptase